MKGLDKSHKARYCEELKMDEACLDDLIDRLIACGSVQDLDELEGALQKICKSAAKRANGVTGLHKGQDRGRMTKEQAEERLVTDAHNELLRTMKLLAWKFHDAKKEGRGVDEAMSCLAAQLSSAGTQRTLERLVRVGADSSG